MKELWQNKGMRLSLLGLGLLVLLAILAPALSPRDPDLIDLPRRLLPPGSGAWLGTDALGRDLASRLLYGARISLSVGTLAVILMTAIGVSLGAIAGYFGGWVDMGITRCIDVLLCMPGFFLIMALISVLGPGILSVVIVIVLTGWTGTARLVRAELLSLKQREFVLSATAAGATAWRKIGRHLIPNALATVYANATFGIAGAVLLESGLSFLGLGVQAPTPSWGNILDDGRQYIATAWWLTVFPGLAILGTMLLINRVGEGLREHFDSKALKNA
jgi:peptide/nickel transport system permease protein